MLEQVTFFRERVYLKSRRVPENNAQLVEYFLDTAAQEHELEILMNEAAMVAVEEKFSKIEAATAAAEEATSGSSSQSFLGGMAHTIKSVHFDQALRKISPSVSNQI
nr:cell division cycle 48C [Tanacetum cinerariifolium]